MTDPNITEASPDDALAAAANVPRALELAQQAAAAAYQVARNRPGAPVTTLDGLWREFRTRQYVLDRLPDVFAVERTARQVGLMRVALAARAAFEPFATMDEAALQAAWLADRTAAAHALQRTSYGV